MVNGEIVGTISAVRVEEPGDIFIPSSNREIVVVLEPEPIESFQNLPRFTVPKKSLVIDIETTGTDPTETRLMVIGYLDPAPENPETVVILEATEEKTLRAFMDFYEAEGYSEIIGYNVDFDFRYLFTLLQKYRIQAPNYMKSDLYDMLQVQKTGQPRFVSTLNKPNKLEDWGEHLLGLEKDGTNKEVQEAWEKGNFEIVIAHNQTDLIITYGLWVLDQFARANIQVVLPPQEQRTISFEQNSPARIVTGIPQKDKEFRTCPKCLAGQAVNKGSKNNVCILGNCNGLL